MPKQKRKHGEAAKEHDRLLEDARQRSRAIDSFVDLIPARFYLASDNPQVLAAKPGLDPAKIRGTSRIVSDAAAAQSAGEGPSEEKTMTKAAKRRLQRRGKSSPKQPAVAANSREELHAKLERRIAELKEERRRRQQDKDKAKAGGAEGAKAPALAAPARAAAGAEVGRLAFDGKEGTVPFEATVGRRGDKMRRMRSELRRAESEAGKLRRAEDEGRGDEVRRDLALQKALKRARGEKVHDDTGKLRKAQRSLESKRVKGKEKWDARKDEVKQAIDDKQKKRKENLAKRANSKKAKKQMRSGFEGERGDGFINSDK